MIRTRKKGSDVVPKNRCVDCEQELALLGPYVDKIATSWSPEANSTVLAEIVVTIWSDADHTRRPLF
jgi:hypothetical protein